MAIIKFNAALAIASASLLSIFCIQKNKKREHCFTVIGEEENIENDEGDSMEIHFSSTPRNKRIIADAVGLRIEPWGFSNPHIASLLAQLSPLQADVTEHDEIDQALMKAFGIIGPPAILFFDSNGQEMRAWRLVGYFPPEEFAEHLAGVLASQ